MPPAGALHSSIVDRMNRLFTLGLDDRAIVRVQGQIPLSDWSSRHLTCRSWPPARPSMRGSTPGRTNACSSSRCLKAACAEIREIKLPLYAAAGILERPGSSM